MMFASVRHAELENEHTCNKVTCNGGGLGSAVALGSALALALDSALASEISALVLSLWEVLVGFGHACGLGSSMTSAIGLVFDL